jgi:hypothetical protein
MRRSLLAAMWPLALAAGTLARVEGPEVSRPIRGMMVEAEHVGPDVLRTWKARGANAVVVPLDGAAPRERWRVLAAMVAREGLALYPWIEVARNPTMAGAHPEWMASVGGHHDDWRRRFPSAPASRPGEVIKVWPWVPIGYAPALDAHRTRIESLLDGLPGPWDGVFLNDLQAGPSSCGCGNDQCRWALDYGCPSTAPKTPGDDAAARLVAGVRARYPGKAVVPVWVTECEVIDMPGAERGTGACGQVECAKNDCWTRYARGWNPLRVATPGPLAVGLWSEAFRRKPNWADAGLSLFRHPPRGGEAIEPSRSVAVLQGWGRTGEALKGRIEAAGRDGGGWVVAIDPVDQSWEPRPFKVVEVRGGVLHDGSSNRQKQ